MSRTLSGKAVVVTGAGRGLGEAFAKLAGAEGASVIVNGLDAARAEGVAAAIRMNGGQARSIACDISTWAGAAQLVDGCLAAFGRLDGFVNNAAHFHMAAIAEETEDGVRRAFETNALGTAFCGLAALRQMIGQGYGSLVNIVSGAHAGISGMSTYGATKGAAASLTYGWAAEVAQTAVRVNAVSPIARTRASAIMEAYARQRGQDLSIDISPASNAPPVVFLLSDAARGVNGQILRIQDGELGLMTHPALRHPGAHDASWTVAKVAEAFERDLARLQLPLGLQSYEVKVGAYSVPYQSEGVAS